MRTRFELHVTDGAEIVVIANAETEMIIVDANLIELTQREAKIFAHQLDLARVLLETTPASSRKALEFDEDFEADFAAFIPEA